MRPTAAAAGIRYSLLCTFGVSIVSIMLWRHRRL